MVLEFSTLVLEYLDVRLYNPKVTYRKDACAQQQDVTG